VKNIIRAAILATFALSILGANAANASGQSQTREDVLREIETKRAELQMLEVHFLSPSQEDYSAYAEFLRQPDTGLIRLLPREVYESETYQKNKKTITMRGGGSYYSFSRLTHEYGFGSDIGLEQGHLKVGFAGTDYGMITNLGDLPLEGISPEHPRLNFLAEYKAPTEEPQARMESRRFATGTVIDDVLYKSHLPVMVNNTYLLRSIDYGASDLLVALRVIRKDTDGSIIIAWRLLKKNPRPELARK
jgi:hypothetical protein